MALLASLAGGLAAVGKLLGAIYPKMKSRIRFRSNLEKLNKEMGKLTNLGNTVKEQIEAAEKRRGQVAAAPAVTMWLEELEAINKEVNSIEAHVQQGNLCPTTPSCCCLGCTLGEKVYKSIIEVRRLIEAVKFFSNSMVVENCQVKIVEHIPGPSIIGQSTASKNLLKVMNLLNDDDGASKIGVWGMAGVGKITLVKNLNNQLETASSSAQPFSIIIWVTVSKELDLKRL
ncbi:Disease resistance protein [Camellia lanceoleosa]|uniref:Disease resistance protein n=1 Tax=Camellia lanceoleosa TaxID=1840588 RepID=A0ACC0H115_9ERIC|nr:Disease resistance protein [Camellia lanceoleosa]